MSANFIRGLTAYAVGIAIGGAALHVFDGSQLAREQAAHARDNETNTRKLATLSEQTAKAASEAIATHNAAAARIAELDQQITVRGHPMKLTTRRIAPLLLRALVGCASQSQTQDTAIPRIQAPPPAAWAMEPVATPSYHQRLEELFSQ